jgi:hypothetical protein
MVEKKYVIYPLLYLDIINILRILFFTGGKFDIDDFIKPFSYWSISHRIQLVIGFIYILFFLIYRFSFVRGYFIEVIRWDKEKIKKTLLFSLFLLFPLLLFIGLTGFSIDSELIRPQIIFVLIGAILNYPVICLIHKSAEIESKVLRILIIVVCYIFLMLILAAVGILTFTIGSIGA